MCATVDLAFDTRLQPEGLAAVLPALEPFPLPNDSIGADRLNVANVSKGSSGIKSQQGS